jgi:hypothetical protein
VRGRRSSAGRTTCQPCGPPQPQLRKTGQRSCVGWWSASPSLGPQTVPRSVGPSRGLGACPARRASVVQERVTTNAPLSWPLWPVLRADATPAPAWRSVPSLGRAKASPLRSALRTARGRRWRDGGAGRAGMVRALAPWPRPASSDRTCMGWPMEPGRGPCRWPRYPHGNAWAGATAARGPERQGPGLSGPTRTNWSAAASGGLPNAHGLHPALRRR